MPWDLALPLLVCLVTLLLFVGIYWSAKKLLVEPRAQEDADEAS